MKSHTHLQPGGRGAIVGTWPSVYVRVWDGAVDAMFALFPLCSGNLLGPSLPSISTACDSSCMPKAAVCKGPRTRSSFGADGAPAGLFPSKKVQHRRHSPLLHFHRQPGRRVALLLAFLYHRDFVPSNDFKACVCHKTSLDT